MPRRGHWETRLAELGAVMDREQAHQLKIVEEPRCLAVSWQPGTESERQSWYVGLESIPVESAPAADEDARWGWADLLGALGREIDGEAIDVATIVEASGGLLLTGSRQGKYFKRLFPFSDLQDVATDLPHHQGKPGSGERLRQRVWRRLLTQPGRLLWSVHWPAGQRSGSQ